MAARARSSLTLSLTRRDFVPAVAVAAFAGVVATVVSPARRGLLVAAAVSAVVLVTVAVTQREVAWAGVAVGLQGAAALAGAPAGLGLARAAIDAVLLFAVFQVAADAIDDADTAQAAHGPRRGGLPGREAVVVLVVSFAAACAVGAVGLGGVAHGAWLVVPAAAAAVAAMGLLIALARRA
jgi:hypothetical protein